MLNYLNNIFILRLIIFLAFPMLFIAAIYLAPTYAGICIFFNLLILILLIVYLKIFNSSELSLILAIVPTTVGPLLANWYASIHYPRAEEVLTAGADDLVALAFFWAGYLSMIMYLIYKYQFVLKQRRTYHIVLEKIGWGVAIILLFLIIFSGNGFATNQFIKGPEIFNGHHAPSITCLVIARITIVLYATLVAISSDQ